MIIQLNFDWWIKHSELRESEEQLTVRIVGKNNITKIVEHRAQGDGDKWYYDIHYSNGTIERIFNPCHVFIEPDAST